MWAFNIDAVAELTKRASQDQVLTLDAVHCNILPCIPFNIEKSSYEKKAQKHEKSN